MFDAVVKDVLLESLTAATMEAAREFTKDSLDPGQLQRHVAMLVQWHGNWEQQEAERMEALMVSEECCIDVLGALAAAPFACANGLLGSLGAVYSTMITRLQQTALEYRRTAAAQHLAPVLLSSLDPLMRSDAWEGPCLSTFPPLLC